MSTLDQTGSRSLTRMILGSPFLWGSLLTIGFYAAIPYLPEYRPLMERYFCNHPLEYATTFLFMVGIAFLAIKAMQLRAQKVAFEIELIEQTYNPQLPPLENAQRLEVKAEEHMELFGSSWLLNRLRDTGRYLIGRGNSKGLEEHLRYLAELAIEELQRSYALLRTIIWAVPILGFLGTVIGITVALANVNLEQIQTSPDQVASGLAIAFDTTALALTLSLGLVFGSFLVERSEQHLLSQVESFGIKVLLPMFSQEEAEPRGILNVEVEAAEQLMQETEELISRQTAHWHESLEQLRHSWMEVIEEQRADLNMRLKHGMQDTLSEHGDHLQNLRAELVQMVEQLGNRIDEQQHLAETSMRQLMEQFLTRLEQSSEVISTQIETAASNSAGHLEQLQKQEELLLKIISEEKELNHLQKSLSQNLELVRSTDTFEETLHSLNAAVALLTTKARRAA
ncbi:MAG: MotA/TolQ/ExbB proton channel family protein [Planctomycetaceae bacterium]|nr:MotA/TolQ/ExbB proton channel family protein [Planctomycetaceae bacterium]